MTPFTLNLTFTPLSGEPLDLTVTGTFDRGADGCWSQRNGDPGEPPEPGHVDIESIEAEGEAVELHEYDLEKLGEEVWERMISNF